MTPVVDVSDLLASDDLGLRLLAGDPATPVRWVGTSELEDPSPFLEGGELLLTTGLRAPEDAGWVRWVERLAAAGVAAVGFGVGLSHDDVPRALVAAGAAAGLAVLEVPAPTSFIAVSRRVADLLRRSENEAEVEAARDQREMAAEASRPDGTERVLRRLARAADGAAWFLTPDGAVLAASTRAAPPAEAAHALHRVRPQGARAALTDVSPERTLLLRAVGSSPPRWLLVRTGPDAPRAVRGSVGTAAALLAVLAERSGREDRLTLDVTRCALDLLWRGAASAASDVLAALGHDLPDPLVVLRTDGPVPSDVVGADGRWLLAPSDVRSALSGLTGRRVGVGRASPAADAAAALASAQEAHERTRPDRLVVDAEEFTAHGLAGVLGEDGARSYAATLLAPLAALPPDEAARLRETGHAFLAHHGQRQPTADALGLHRNTVRSRITRLERVLGRSMDSPDDRAELWLALSVPPPPPPTVIKDS